jgi:phosphatidate cytidylyltransferase
MLVGSTIGRTPLTPISPKKTWEGAIGGLLATSAVGASFALIPSMHIA